MAIQSAAARRRAANPSKPVITTTLQLVSHHKALEYLNYTYDAQRTLRPYHVQYLRHLMRSGHFRAGSEIHLAQVDGRTLLVNGQHTLTAIVYEQLPQWLQVTVYRVETEAEVAALYQSFDRNLQRSMTDLLRVEAPLHEAQFTRKQLTALSSAIPLLAVGFHDVPLRTGAAFFLRDGQMRAQLIADWLPEAANVWAGMHGPKIVIDTLLRAAVLSVLLVTYRYQPEAAHLFWPSVARDSGLSEGQPAHTLARFLLSTPARSIHVGAYARSVASCWNCAYDHREQYRLSPREAHRPILLAGTPFDGRAVYTYLTPSGVVLHEPSPVTETNPEAAPEA